MEDQPTCGKGLAEHAALPGKLGELTAAVAKILEIHIKALDLQDQNSRKELQAYQELARDHRKAAAQQETLAQRMAGYRDLPMGRHDEKRMAAPIAREAFEEFVKLEQDLLTLLQRRLVQDRQMLTAMRGAGSPS